MNSKRTPRITRRGALKASAGLTLSATLAASASSTPKVSGGSIYESLGVRPVINAGGTFTNLGGSLMPPEVVNAWVEASRHFVNLSELQDRCGEKIAHLIGVEAALITTGAAGALLLGTAAVVTGSDRDRIRRLPDTEGGKNEVIIQKTHHSCYDNQLTDVGVKLIDVISPEDVQKAINPRTAMMFFMNISNGEGRIPREGWVKLARKHRIPTLLDAAADAPPVERLSEYTRLGFDLVAFSGGKAIRGPNDTGLLLGSKALIAAAKLNANPNCGTIGRMMKVSKEDMVALVAAVERFVKLDAAAEVREWDRRIDVIRKALVEVPTLTAERIVPAIANCVPHLNLTWDEKKLKLTPAEVTRMLAAGDPSIVIGRVHGTGDRGILISVFVLRDDEEKIVADRLKAIFTKTRKN